MHTGRVSSGDVDKHDLVYAGLRGRFARADELVSPHINIGLVPYSAPEGGRVNTGFIEYQANSQTDWHTNEAQCKRKKEGKQEAEVEKERKENCFRPKTIFNILQTKHICQNLKKSWAIIATSFTVVKK